jgi:MFS family permease
MRPAAPPRPNAAVVIAGGGLLCIAVGSLYAWSLFYAPIEGALGIGRAWLAGTFSAATIVFAIGMVATPWLVRGVGAPRLALLAGALSAAGMALPGLVREVWAIVLGYGALYGAGSGIAYSAALQAAMLALPHRRGLAAGTIAVTGALGSVLGSIAFGAAIPAIGPWTTLLLAGGAFLLLGIAAAALMRGIVMPDFARAPPQGEESAAERRLEGKMWLGFFFGAAAGLTALGHAAGIAGAYGASLATIAIATAMTTGANGVGRFAAGWLADFVPVRRLLLLAPLPAAAMLAALLLAPSQTLAIATLVVTGLAYGILAAAYPAAVAIYFGVARTGLVYGRVFTAWGIAGLIAPSLAGHFYDESGNYAAALAFAAAAALLSSLVAATLPAAPRIATT